MADSDPIMAVASAQSQKRKDKHGDSLIAILGDAVSSMRIKLVVILFIIVIFVFSDVFERKVISRINGALDGYFVTNYGLMIQAFIVVLLFSVAEFLTNQDIL
ncbi:MAG: hypothetical protein M0R33_13730 [Methylomonas sp.]|jgi:hypothetical protein|uniref:hypothetical protein n=1 Tax=Methylomonas sp. TaxID=418 RepID=UPI0025ED71B6|nr:hypothetical protein [Methylomonas sp.]MCK9607495.1 hypothetical protein [Methylomonas sp.]